jgi:hypothetical protein
MGIKKGWPILPFEYISFDDLTKVAVAKKLSVGLDLYGSFFSAILQRSQKYVDCTLKELSTSFRAENITFAVVADCKVQVSEQKALARASRLEASVSAVQKYCREFYKIWK